MARYNRMDVYALYKHGEVKPADLIHHIHPAVEAEKLFYVEQNLIPVSVQSHAEIHLRYKNERQVEVEAELIQMCMKFAQKSLGGSQKSLEKISN